MQSLMTSSSKLEKEQCARILAHLNENGIGSWPDPFFRRCKKCSVGTRLHSGYAYDIAIQVENAEVRKPKYRSEKKAAYCLTDPPLCVLRLCSQTVIVSQQCESLSPALSTNPSYALVWDNLLHHETDIVYRNFHKGSLVPRSLLEGVWARDQSGGSAAVSQ